MLGAIVGDVIGSRFEFSNRLSTQFKLFAKECSFTDDTVCTIAVADAILNNLDFGQTLRRWCAKYPSPMGSYGTSFFQWLHSTKPLPYNSYGNGSAMRVSPCAWLSADYETALTNAKLSAECTHNHPEGIKGAVALTDCIWHLRHGANKNDIRMMIEQYGYQLNKSCDQMRKDHFFDETCQGTIPCAVTAFLESCDFENAIRLAVSIGGDTDTIADITGAISEAHYGVPLKIKEEVLMYLPDEFIEILNVSNRL